MKRIASFIVALLMLVTTSTYAQFIAGEDRLGAIVDQVFSAAQITADEVMSRFNRSLEKKAPELAGKVKVEVSVEYVFGAFSATSPPRVRLPHLFVLEQWLAAEGIAQMEIRPEIPRDAVNQYMVYLASRSLSISPDERKKVVYERFGQWIRIPIRQLNQNELQQLTVKTELIMRDALAFAVAHELGHLAYRHRVPIPATEWRVGYSQEYEADKFAMEILEESKMSTVLGAILQLPRFSTEEFKHRRARSSGRRTHPAPECRLLRVLMYGENKKVLDDSKKRRDGLLFSRISETEYQRALKSAKEDCDFEFDLVANTVVAAPKCDELVSNIRKFAKNPLRFHGSDRKEDRFSVFSTTSEKLTGAESCTLFTTHDPDDQSYSFSCKWPFIHRDQDRANEEAERTAGHVAGCFGATFKKSAPGKVVIFRGKPKITNIGDVNIMVRSNATSTGVEIELGSTYTR
jgi:hypothetical protein